MNENKNKSKKIGILAAQQKNFCSSSKLTRLLVC